MMKKRFYLSTTQIIMLTFLTADLIGSVLLALPISSATGQAVPYLDALFTSTTSVCVTGLVTVPTVTTWSVFGQVVILILIQVGGLGVVTVMATMMLSLHKRIGIGDRILIQDAFNLNTLSGIVKFVKNVLLGTAIVEGAGALLYMTVFVPQYGARGIWISIFNSISAFCNAGLDILSENSLCDYALNPIINLTTSLLVILGGIGFIVWWDVLSVLRNFRKGKRMGFSALTLHSKIALSMTFSLLLVGFLLFFVFEYNNPNTLKDLTLPQKLMVSFFQSMTTRTAGFATIPQENLSNASSIVSLGLMFIGGSPTGTAGGIKTVTIAVLFVSAFSSIKNRDDGALFQRTIKKGAVSKSVAVTCVAFLIQFVAAVLLEALTNADVMDVLYEAISATATVGLSRNFTSTLGPLGKIVVIVTMYLGRVGPVSLFIALNTRRGKPNIIKNPSEQISVG
ncbi:MAG: potassium transporter KtrB [Firmicutes bacterium]|nr:potassium transporter KtrB [Bacillota bacterium]